MSSSDPHTTPLEGPSHYYMIIIPILQIRTLMLQKNAGGSCLPLCGQRLTQGLAPSRCSKQNKANPFEGMVWTV